MRRFGLWFLAWSVAWTLCVICIPVGLFCMLGLIILGIYSITYFKGKKFNAIKDRIVTYINDCNELNHHIEELRSSYVDVKKTDYGEASFNNTSKYNYKKKGLDRKFAPNIYDCSRQVCSSASEQPFKYICKYFNIDADEESLAQFEDILNNFSAAEEGKVLLKNKKDEILKSIKSDVPWIIRTFWKKKLDNKLGFEEIAFNELYFPRFVFRYTSSGGKSSNQFTVTFDIPMLERFVGYLNDNIKRRKSAAGQRALMTPKLREHIKQRDHFTCKNCNNSTSIEPNLLLEIDHIIPIAKGGMTEESNLQTLCWKCNRTKGVKM